MRIAIFDYIVSPRNPIGGCHWRMLRALSRDHDFTVFSVEFENPDLERIHWVRVPALRRPLPLLFLSFHLLAPFCYLWQKLVRRRRFDIVQVVESNLSFGDVSYSHFCHRTYLSEHWDGSGPTSLRRWSRWLDHTLHARLEASVYKRMQSVVVPSRGLARELQREYPYSAKKIRVLPNPVEIEVMERPADFDRSAFRRDWSIGANDLVLVFVALGHFERKGLNLILEALAKIRRSDVKLLVVGGNASLTSSYRSRAETLGVSDAVVFAGMQRDVRPFLWMADVFIFPSAYEVFSLALLEAAAAGLPIVVPPLNGAEEFIDDRVNGVVIERSADGVAAGIMWLLSLGPEQRVEIGRQARRDVARYSVGRFADLWRDFYNGIRAA